MPEDMENNILHMLKRNLGQYVSNKKMSKESYMEKCEKLQWTKCLLGQDSKNGFSSLSVILAGQEESRRAFRTITHNFHVGLNAQ